LTACWPTSWLRPMSCWCPNGVGRSQQHSVHQGRRLIRS
jgi:hypothetical protein